ncbi:hypothetical protein JR316_0007448 [Psilocybe cubensis]|uniref:Uncharacterized protein n=2 Tax=Psilocybe cubensis TaxID=181762 RepID=A0ACB8GYZ5_PSICU|nr:hypothetical protein JR316_0007448 [Psilocybe cubensis]KAH9480846.1 hypothetical protein JR316_0007448 [Psilocybe cubensis]
MPTGLLNVTIASDSPTVKYLPFSDGDLNGGWNMTCSNSNDKTYIPQSFCNGQAQRRTSFPEASLSIDFYGTAAYIFGSAASPSYLVQVDGQTLSETLSSSSSGLLAKIENLDYGKHTIALNLTGASLVTFTQAIFTTIIGDENSTIQNQTMRPFTQNSDGSLAVLNNTFTYTGQWIAGAPGSIGAAGNAVYARESTSQLGAFVTFNVERASAFFIYGIVNTDLSTYKIDLTNSGGNTVSNIYNASGRWIDLDVVMYWAAGLDRNDTYSVKMTNLGGGDAPWSSNNTASSSPTASPHTHNKPIGPIVGGVVGGLAIILLGTLAWLLLRRRSRRLGESSLNTRPTIFDTSRQPSTVHESGLHSEIHMSGNGLNSMSAGASVVANRSYSNIPNPSSKAVIMAPPSTTASSMILESGSPSVVLSPEGRNALFYQEEDAGSVSERIDSTIVRLPPGYKDTWASSS